MDPRVRLVITHIKGDLRCDPSLNTLAENVSLSSSRLRHLFKSEMGVSFAQYVKSLRMQEAKRLLETTFLSVKEVMYRVGIRNESHFTQDFKKAYGLTPSQHRRRFHHIADSVSNSDNG
jgi:transcriptional regulator GlxA family with amidase domain